MSSLPQARATRGKTDLDTSTLIQLDRDGTSAAQTSESDDLAIAAITLGDPRRGVLAADTDPLPSARAVHRGAPVHEINGSRARRAARPRAANRESPRYPRPHHRRPCSTHRAAGRLPQRQGALRRSDRASAFSPGSDRRLSRSPREPAMPAASHWASVLLSTGAGPGRPRAYVVVRARMLVRMSSVRMPSELRFWRT